MRKVVKDICVIGAGPSGLAALKVIAETPQYKEGIWRPVAFEAREALGGVWYAFNIGLARIIIDTLAGFQHQLLTTLH